MNWRELPDRQLLDLCLQGDELAWDEFLRRFQRIIHGVAYNTYRTNSPDHKHCDEGMLEDFFQAVMNKLLADDMRALRLFAWETDNAFRGFIKVTTANVVLDQIRKDRSGKRDKSKEISIDPAMPLAMKSEAADVDYKILLHQIARCLEKHTDPYLERTRDIAIFLLYFGHGHKVTAMELSKVYKLNVRLVENIIAKLTRVARSKCLGRAAAKS